MRVNQAGYPTGAPKRAYLLASVAEPRATYRVTNARGRTVLAGAVGPALGRWSARYPHVYALDFTRLRTAGRYRISVAGAAAAASPPFRVASGARLSRQPLRNALAFYQDERDGPDFIRTPLRTAPGHLNDAHAMTYATPQVDGDGNFAGDLHPLGVRIDAAGGWWDAGDYLKFVETTGYTDAVLLAAVRDFPRQTHVRVHGHTFAAEAALRRPLAAADVGRPHAHAVLPGRHRRGQRSDPRRPRHLAPAAGRRHATAARPGHPATSATGRSSAPARPARP